jgi:GAF domain-containing protein/HAMP domain-containing protein
LIFGFIIYLFTLPIIQPLQRLTVQAQELSSKKFQTAEGRLIEPIRIRTRDELEDLADAFNQMAASVAAAFESLEEKVAVRTQHMERSTMEFSIIAEIARDITIIRDLDTLLNVSANLIRERFNYYHVGIFLLDRHGEYAVLRAASSFAAQQMLEQNYRLRVGQGLVGNVMRTGQAHIALDVGSDAVHFQNPFLPDTHSEIALPLRSRSVAIGALDIQTTVESAFDDRDLNILQLLADLLAGAIENAELSEQVKTTLTELNTTYRSQSQRIWQNEALQRESPAYEYDGLQVRQVPSRLPADLLQKLENGEPIIIKETGESQRAVKTLMVPIKILNQVIGVIGLEQDTPDQPWTEADIAIVQAAANRAALTLENARLLEESQRRAVKERAIFEATARIGSALNIENILHTTVEEIERVTNSTEVILQFTKDKKV